MEDDRHCDWRGRCKRKPYAEVFPLTPKPEDKRELPCDVWYYGNWSYLCYWHFQYERAKTTVRRLFGCKKRLGWGKAETTTEYLVRLEEEAVWEAEDDARSAEAAAESDAEAEARWEAMMEETVGEEAW